MPPIGGYYPTGPGPGPMTPEQSEAMVKQAVAAFKVAFPDPAVLHKGEITAIKNELNALNLAVNGIKGEFNIVSAQSDLVRLETKPLFDLQEYLAGKKGERPDQIKAEAAAAQKRADGAHQLAQNSLRRVNQIDSALQRVVTNQVAPLRAQVTQLDRRIVAAARDATAALQGVRRVGTDLDTARKALSTRINKVENQKSGQGKGAAGIDAKKLREEGDRTRKAVKDLETAVNGTGRVMNQFSQRLRSIEQTLR